MTRELIQNILLSLDFLYAQDVLVNLGSRRSMPRHRYHRVRTKVKIAKQPTATYDLGTGKYLSKRFMAGYLDS